MSRQTLNWLLGSVCAHCQCLSWTCSAFHSFSLECCLWDFDVLRKSFWSLESTLFELQSWHFDAGMIVHSTVLQDLFALCKWVHLFLWRLHICLSFIPCAIFFVHCNFALCSNMASPRPEMLFHCFYSTAARFSEKKGRFYLQQIHFDKNFGNYVSYQFENCLRQTKSVIVTEHNCESKNYTSL